MKLNIRRLSPVLGAEVRDIDLRDELSAETVDAIKAAWREHLVLLFRDQQLDVEAQKRFTRHFGELALSGTESAKREDDVLLLGNFEIEGRKVSQYAMGEMQFHQDGVYVECPTKATFLYGIEIPPTGGNTCFVSTNDVYNALAPAVRTRIEGLAAKFNYFTNMKRGVDPLLSLKRPEFIHPLVIAHPETGKPAMICNRLMTDSIVGLAPDESAALLEEIYAVMEDPARQYQHEWRVGDLLLWDNLGTAHSRTWYDPSYRRLHQRTTVRGNRPVALRPEAVSASA